MFAKALLYTATLAILILSVVPNYKHLPEVFSLSDILNHLGAFVVLSALLDFAYSKLKTSQKIFMLLGYGLFIEIVQYFIPYRKFSVEDLLIDALGVAVYFLVTKKLVASMLKTF
ncbi:MAG: VanZ family protein [Nitrospirae bacterium]|nr:VanZ family protein [Nitrospirota bacterium]